MIAFTPSEEISLTFWAAIEKIVGWRKLQIMQTKVFHCSLRLQADENINVQTGRENWRLIDDKLSRLVRNRHRHSYKALPALDLHSVYGNKTIKFSMHKNLFAWVSMGNPGWLIALWGFSSLLNWTKLSLDDFDADKSSNFNALICVCIAKAASLRKQAEPSCKHLKWCLTFTFLNAPFFRGY